MKLNWSKRVDTRFVVRLIALAFVLTSLPSARAQSTERGEQPAYTQPDESWNDYCPVMLDEFTDPSYYVDHNGRRVYLCCQTCMFKFRRNPDLYIARLALMDAGLDASIIVDPSEKDDDAGSTDEQRDRGEGQEAGRESAPRAVQATRSRVIVWLGKFHPALVHFPIALLSAGALAELLYLRTRRSMWRAAGAYCAVLGGLGAIVAAALGWASAGFTLVDKDTIRLIHRWLGTGVAVVAVAAMGTVSLTDGSDADGKPDAKLKPRVLVLLAGLSAMAAGFFGGAIVWGLDHYGF